MRLQKEIESKLHKTRLKLEKFHEYKALLREDGLKPDAEDKQKESRLIQQILGFEKDLKRLNKGNPADKLPKTSEKFAKAKARVKRPH